MYLMLMVFLMNTQQAMCEKLNLWCHLQIRAATDGIQNTQNQLFTICIRC